MDLRITDDQDELDFEILGIVVLVFCVFHVFWVRRRQSGHRQGRQRQTGLSCPVLSANFRWLAKLLTEELTT